ncbi:hypothetical protein AB4Z54_02920, partial [Streptomyces sp. MCAF7]
MVGNKRLGDREGCTASGPEGTWRDEEAALALSEARIELEWERSGGTKIVTERRGAPGGDSGGDVTVPGSTVSGLAAPDTAAPDTAAPDTATPDTADSRETADSTGAATHDADSGPRQPTPHTDAELAEPTALHDHPLTGASVVRPAQLPA